MWQTYLAPLGLSDDDNVCEAWGNAAVALWRGAAWRDEAHRAEVMAPVGAAIRASAAGRVEIATRGDALSWWASGLKRAHEAQHGRLASSHPAITALLDAFEAEQSVRRGESRMGACVAAHSIVAALALGLAPDAVARELIARVESWRAYRNRPAPVPVAPSAPARRRRKAS